MKAIILLISLIAVTTAKSPAHFGTFGGRIVGGELAYLGQFPYQAGISFHRGADYMWCGGSILSPRWILTAAHCVYNVDPDVTVYVGITNKAFIFGGQSFHISDQKDLIPHEHYDKKMIKNDIGLIRLSEDIQYNNDVLPVQLVQRENADETFVGRTSVASGWGKLHDSDPLTADDLHWVTLTPISNEDCKPHFGAYLTDDNICVATGGKSICSGDSGGPLVTLDTYEQIGINSFVSGGGCESDAPAVLVRVTNFLDWIKDNTGLNV